MKTAEEWGKEYAAQRHLPMYKRTLVHRDGSFTRAIQLDAMKEGMRRAADTCKPPLQQEKCYGESESSFGIGYNAGTAEFNSNILIAADNLTLEDLK